MPGKDTLFSIIVPTYNREAFIEKTIKSILAQTYKHFEVIIADDGSTDNTEQVVKAIGDERVHYYKKENGERGAARNFGIAKAIGDFITFVDSDDILYPNHFAEAISLLAKEPSANVFHLAYEYRDTEGKLLAVKTHSHNFNQQLIHGNVISCIGIFVKQGILKDDLLFSEIRTLSGTEDWLLWLRLAARYKFYYSNNITACMINHDSRSVLNYDEKEMLLRTELLLDGLKADKVFMEVNGKFLPSIEAHMLSYLALHLQLSNQRDKAWGYFMKSIRLDIGELFTRRSLAIIKRQFF